MTAMRTRSAAGTGLTLIALGAIFAFAVQGHPSWLNIQIVGWVLILTGIVAMAFPRRGYGWLRRWMVLGRGPGGRPVVDGVEEKHCPPYIMLNPGSNAVAGEVVTDPGSNMPAAGPGSNMPAADPGSNMPAAVDPLDEQGPGDSPVDEHEAELR